MKEGTGLSAGTFRASASVSYLHSTRSVSFSLVVFNADGYSESFGEDEADAGFDGYDETDKEEINAESDRKNDEETIEAMASYSAVKG